MNRKKKKLLSAKIWRERNPAKFKKSVQKYHQRLKLEVLDAYSEGKIKCACCGEERIEFLSIDHIKGGGTEHRKKLKSKGHNLYQWLRRNGYPKGYRVLCFNCNHSYGHYGYCPHQKEKL